MTTLRSTLIQAVEALEMGHHLHPRQDLNGAVLAALRAQIEALDKAEPVICCANCGGEGYTPAYTNDGEFNPTHCDECDGKGVIPTHPQPTIPEGWQLVPKEPTPEMQNCMDKGSAYNTWKNMLAAAPEAPK